MPILLKNLDDLVSMRRAELATAWAEVFRAEAPFCPNPELYRNGIAWALQEREERISPTLRRRLNQLADGLEAKKGKRPIKAVTGSRLRSGTTIVREWRGESHVVIVAGKAFIYGGKPYRSLSEITREITGTRWNGPAFFGLRPGAGRVAEVIHG